MIILGVDPGLRVTGYGVIQEDGGRVQLIEAGVITTQPRSPISERLRALYEGLIELICDRKPHAVALEKLFSHSAHPATSILMGHARGVICLAAGMHDIPLANIPSTRVKKSVISHGHASKDQIARAVQGILGLKQAPGPYDVTDALAVAISFAFTHRHAGHAVYA